MNCYQKIVTVTYLVKKIPTSPRSIDIIKDYGLCPRGPFHGVACVTMIKIMYKSIEGSVMKLDNDLRRCSSCPTLNGGERMTRLLVY